MGMARWLKKKGSTGSIARWVADRWMEAAQRKAEFEDDLGDDLLGQATPLNRDLRSALEAAKQEGSLSAFLQVADRLQKQLALQVTLSSSEQRAPQKATPGTPSDGWTVARITRTVARPRPSSVVLSASLAPRRCRSLAQCFPVGTPKNVRLGIFV